MLRFFFPLVVMTTTGLSAQNFTENLVYEHLERNITGVVQVSKDTVYAFAQGGNTSDPTGFYMYKSFDEGETWSETSVCSNYDEFAQDHYDGVEPHFINSNKGIVVMNNTFSYQTNDHSMGVYYTNDSGDSWVRTLSLPAREEWNDSISYNTVSDVIFKDKLNGLLFLQRSVQEEDDLIPAFNYTTVYSTSDGGASWSELSTLTKVGISDVDFVEGKYIALSSLERDLKPWQILKSDDDGLNWELIYTSTSESIDVQPWGQSLDFINENVGYITLLEKVSDSEKKPLMVV